MTVQIEIKRRCLQFSSAQQSFAKASDQRRALERLFKSGLASNSALYTSVTTLSIHPSTVDWMIRKYSEQLVYRPLEEIRHWFTYSSGTYLQPGYPPLFYARTVKHEVSPNKSAVAAIGEGVAGLITQKLYCARKLARPYHDFPDIVSSSNYKTYLVEAKATTRSEREIKQTIDKELQGMVKYAAVCKELDARPVMGLLVGTFLLNEVHYRTYVTEVAV